MNHLGTLACCMLFSVVAARAGLGQGLGVDWKFYGGASIKGDQQSCSMKLRASPKRLTVTYGFGTKCLPETALDNIDIKAEIRRQRS